MINNISNYGGQYTVKVQELAHKAKKFIHFDTDDLLTELYEEHHLIDVYKNQGLSDLTKGLYYNSHLVTVTQSKFAERVKPFCRGVLAIIKNSIDYNLPCWNAPKVNTKFTKIGWAGGIHHNPDVKVFASIPHLVNQKAGRENVFWDFYGMPPPQEKKPMEKRDWQDKVWDNYKAELLKGFKGQRNWNIHQALGPDAYGVFYSNMDIAIAPLQMNAFNDSKCWRPGQELLMYDGTFKKVEDIKIGDILMGPDSTPRNVISLYNGKGNMCKITPNKGEPFYVTDNHILRLKTNDAASLKWKKPQYVEVTVKDYLSRNKSFQYNYRLYREKINFTNTEPLPVDPYFVGIMLGDGSLGNGTFAITTMDEEIESYFRESCMAVNSDIKFRKDTKPNNKASSIYCSKLIRNRHIKNPLSQHFESIGLNGVICGDKYIPHQYKTASYGDRLQLLAGLIDTDGCLTVGTFYTISSKSKKLMEDAAFIARSVGLYVATDKKEINGTWYHYIRISGNVSIIPTKLPRKKAGPRKARRDALTSGFKVEVLGEEPCVGIQVDKDGLVLMSDFTVTHNSDIKACEAGRYKVPLVASNVGCYSDVIKNGETGFLIDPDAPKTEWVRILSKLVKDPKLTKEMGENLHRITEERYDMNKVAIDRLKIYDQCFKHFKYDPWK